MAGSVDDFMQRFGGQGAVSEQDTHQAFDRFASNQPNDQAFDSGTMQEGATEYLGKLPDDQFQQAATNAFAQAPPQQKQGLLSSLFGGLQGRGVDVNQLGGQLGLQSMDPQHMSPDDLARVVNFVRKEHPQILQQTVSQQPWFTKALGHPILMGILAVVATKMMKGRFGG